MDLTTAGFWAIFRLHPKSKVKAVWVHLTEHHFIHLQHHRRSREWVQFIQKLGLDVAYFDKVIRWTYLKGKRACAHADLPSTWNI